MFPSHPRVCVECVLPASEWLLFPPRAGSVYSSEMYDLKTTERRMDSPWLVIFFKYCISQACVDTHTHDPFFLLLQSGK